MSESEVNAQLKDGESATLYVRLKDGSGKIDLQEDLSNLEGLFSYVRTEGTSDSGQAEITDTGQGATIELSEGDEVAVTVHNRYRTNDLTVQKKDAETGDGLSGAVFDLYTSQQGDTPWTTDTMEYDGSTYYKLRTVQSDSTGQMTLDKLPAGTRTYLLVESQAPNGYAKIEAPIVLQTEGNGFSLLSDDDDVILAGSDLTVQDHQLYSLPSAGGIGWYPFLIGGGFMAGLALMLLRRRRIRD
ncbi:MAG: prealbumin-like fold domain-containing protein [Anaerovoracaceae bacterium]|jgi:LPXTG-motif cell wall-anchored protein